MEKVQGMQMITVMLKMVPSFTCSTKCFFKLSSDVLKFRFFTKRDRDWILLKVKPKKLIETIRNDYQSIAALKLIILMEPSTQ